MPRLSGSGGATSVALGMGWIAGAEAGSAARCPNTAVDGRNVGGASGIGTGTT